VVDVGATVVGGTVTGGGALVGAAAGVFPPPEQAAATHSSPAAPTATTARRACWKPMEMWLWAVALVAVAGGLFWLAARLEPHWSSPDGTRFTCSVQEIDAVGRPLSRWYDARAEVVDGRVAIRKKLLMRSGAPVDPRPVSARSDHPPRGKAIYLLPGDPLLAVRIPDSSRAVACLDALVHR
jgi:hypothetical protein